MNTKKENATVKNNVVADTTFHSLHNIIERYGDAGFWNTAYSTLIKFQYGGCASTNSYPMSSALAGSVLALRSVAGVFAILEASIEEIERHSSEKNRRENIVAQQILQEELIAQLLPFVEEVNATNDFYDADNLNELSLAEINEILLQVFLAVYEENEALLSDIDNHVKYSLMRGLDNMIVVREPRKLYLRIIQAAGDFIYGNIFGISFVTGIATLLSLIPGVNVVMLAMLISAAVVGLAYGLLKVIRNIYSDRKHDVIRKTLVEQQQEFEKSLRLLVALDYAQQIGQKDNMHSEDEEVDMEDCKELELIDDPKRAFMLRVGFKLFYIAAIGVVVGASSVYTINTFVTSFASITGASLGLAGAALTAIPIIGAVVTFAFYSFKVLMGMLENIKQEKNLIKHVNNHLEAQNERAKDDAYLRELIQLNDLELLVEFIGLFVSAQQSEEEQPNSAVFLNLVEGVLGVKKNQAKTVDSFYGYLSFVLLGILDENESTLLVTDLRDLIETDKEFASDVELIEKFVKQNKIFRKNEDGSLDHKGNVKRLLEFVKQAYKHTLNATIPLVIGLAVGLLFASGPAFPIVASVFAALLVTIYIINKVLEHRQEKRVASYDKTLATVEMRDKAVEYALINQHEKNNYGRFFSKNKSSEEETESSLNFASSGC